MPASPEQRSNQNPQNGSRGPRVNAHVDPHTLDYLTLVFGVRFRPKRGESFSSRLLKKSLAGWRYRRRDSERRAHGGASVRVVRQRSADVFLRSPASP
jgi:hypothetical protein